MKYIIIAVDVPIGPIQPGDNMIKEIPIIFPDDLVHSDVADHMKHLLIRNYRAFHNPRTVSAGFIQFRIEGVHCDGESETLRLQARPQDARIIQNYDYEHGWVNGDIDG